MCSLALPRSLGVVLLLAACAGCAKEQGTSAPNPPATAAEAAAPNDASGAEAAPSPAAAVLVDVTSEEMHVGRLVVNQQLSLRHPSEYCLEDKTLYQGAGYRLGKENVFGIDEALKGLEGEGGPLAVYATRKMGLYKALRSLGPCPEDYEPIQVQMRSDWMAPEGGPISTRSKLQSLSYLEATRAVPLHMSEIIESTEEAVRMRIGNPFNLPLSGLDLLVHYEGGPGKPMPTYVEKVLSLEPGQWTEIELPRRLDTQPARTKAGSDLRSLKLSGQLGKASLAIEILVPASRGR